MIAGASWAWWIGFHAAVAALLMAEAWLAGRRRGAAARSPWLAPLLVAICAAGFAAWMALAHGRQAALEWVAGYTIEESLSIDNLFVFMVLFRGFEVGPERQRKALLWGVAGAIVLRGLFIAAGITLLNRFSWITWILGSLLLYAAWRLLRGRSAREVIPGWIRRLQPSHRPQDTGLGVPSQGSLLPVILAVEFADLLFAIDSVPAVLAVTRNPFIAYTSNVAAILGLRTLYFALGAMLDRFPYLHYGLGAILAFVGLKMMLSPWVDLPIVASLAVIGAILLGCALANAILKPAPGC